MSGPAWKEQIPGCGVARPGEGALAWSSRGRFSCGAEEHSPCTVVGAVLTCGRWCFYGAGDGHVSGGSGRGVQSHHRSAKKPQTNEHKATTPKAPQKPRTVAP